MNLAAQKLVEEDARASRGLVPEEELIDDQLELEDLLRRPGSPSPADVKGKGRATQDDDDEADRRPPGSPSLYGPATPLAEDHDHAAAHDDRRRRDFFAFGRDRRRRSMNPETARSKKRRERAFWQAAAVNLAFIASWYFFSTLISVYNKWMFSPEHYNFGFPLFVTSFHMVVQFTLSAIVIGLFPSLRPNARPQAKEYALKAGPCGVATGLDIGLSNLSLKTITLSFYTMCKSSSLGFVLLFAFLFRLERPTWRLVGIIALITVGVVLMVSAETQFHLVGMLEVLAASAMGGLRWSLTQLLLDRQAMGFTNPVATLFWLAPIMASILGICSLIFEGPRAVFGSDAFFGTVGRTFKTFGLIFFPGVLAFCMTVSEFMLIQRTSVVTLSVAGIFKEVATIFLSTTIFHDQLTPINISGLCIAIFGIALYNYLKYREYDPDATKEASLKTDGFVSLDDDGRRSPPSRDPTHSLDHKRPPLYTIADPRDSDSSSENEMDDDRRAPGDDDDAHIHLLHGAGASEAQIADLDRALAEDPGLKRLAGVQAELERELVPAPTGGKGSGKRPSPEGSEASEGWEVFESPPRR